MCSTSSKIIIHHVCMRVNNDRIADCSLLPCFFNETRWFIRGAAIFNQKLLNPVNDNFFKSLVLIWVSLNRSYNIIMYNNKSSPFLIRQLIFIIITKIERVFCFNISCKDNRRVHHLNCAGPIAALIEPVHARCPVAVIVTRTHKINRCDRKAEFFLID